MPKIICDVSTCGHYKDNACCISPVRVAGNSAQRSNETCCDSFIDARVRKNVHSPEANSHVSCEAQSCVYNSDCVCSAPRIDVAGDGANRCSQTECSSFRP